MAVQPAAVSAAVLVAAAMRAGAAGATVLELRGVGVVHSRIVDGLVALAMELLGELPFVQPEGALPGGH